MDRAFTDRTLYSLASRQLSLLTWQQLLRVGLTSAQVRYRLKVGELERVRFGVYRLTGAPKTWEQSILVAVLAAGELTVASHSSAAALWDMRNCQYSPRGTHLTSPRQLRLEGVTGHCVRLAKDERTTTRSVPVTTPARTIVDLAGTLSLAELGQCLDDALRRRLLGLEELRRVVTRAAESGRGRLLKPVQQLLAERRRGYRPDDSDLETRMNRRWDELGLPAACKQYRVEASGHSYRLDRAVVKYKVGVEWDGYRYHSAPSDMDYDCRRRAHLQAAGWIVIPVTENTDLEVVAAAVRRACADRGYVPGPPAS